MLLVYVYKSIYCTFNHYFIVYSLYLYLKIAVKHYVI